MAISKSFLSMVPLELTSGTYQKMTVNNRPITSDKCLTVSSIARERHHNER